MNYWQEARMANQELYSKYCLICKKKNIDRVAFHEFSDNPYYWLDEVKRENES